jgi:hypothetical protein
MRNYSVSPPDSATPDSKAEAALLGEREVLLDGNTYLGSRQSSA